jgi:hypothetical protein
MMADRAMQKKYLKERLERIAREKGILGWGGSRVKLKKPPIVAAAEKSITRLRALVDRFETKERNYNKKREQRMRGEFDRIQQAILFGDAKVALKLLEKFEKAKF